MSWKKIIIVYIELCLTLIMCLLSTARLTAIKIAHAGFLPMRKRRGFHHAAFR